MLFSEDAVFLCCIILFFFFLNLLVITFNAPFVQSIAAAMTHFPPQGSLKFNFIQSKKSLQNVFACNWQLQLSVNALVFVRFMCHHLSDTFSSKPISLVTSRHKLTAALETLNLTVRVQKHERGYHLHLMMDTSNISIEQRKSTHLLVGAQIHSACFYLSFLNINGCVKCWVWFSFEVPLTRI